VLSATTGGGRPRQGGPSQISSAHATRSERDRTGRVLLSCAGKLPCVQVIGFVKAGDNAKQMGFPDKARALYARAERNSQIHLEAEKLRREEGQR
jgi:hypothetical protein